MNDLIIGLNEFEPIVLIGSIVVTAIFLFKWYMRLLFAWPLGRAVTAKIVLGLLPVAAFFIIFPTLTTYASFDVVKDPYYLLFYTALGFACLYLGVVIMSVFFNISWVDDVLNMNNKAALIAFSGGFIGLTIMYAASNIGDGPGWACVIFTIALGLVLWVPFALIQNHLSQVFDRITIDRDTACAVRFGSFLLANAIFLSRDLAGDWVSTSMTLYDFIPAFIAIGVELLFSGFGKPRGDKPSTLGASGGLENNMVLSVIWAIMMLGGSIAGITVLR